MVIPMALVIDALLLAVILFLIVLGGRRGFIRGLIGFASILAAFLAARYAVRTLSPIVQEKLFDILIGSVEERLLQVELPVGDELNAIRDALPEVLQHYVLSGGAAAVLAERALEMLQNLQQNFASAAAAKAAEVLAQAAAEFLVYAVSFALGLTLTRLLGRLLDRVSRLPVLRECNFLLGALLGAAKAGVLLLGFAWLVHYAGWFVPDELVQKTFLLRAVIRLIEA